MNYLLTFILMAFLISSPLNAQSETASLEKKLTLFDLRIPDDQYTPEMSAERSKKLTAHQHAGRLTVGLAAVSFITAMLAKKETDDDRSARGGAYSKDDAKNFKFHLISAGLTLASYYTTAYFSLSAPKKATASDLYATQWHKRLAYVHMPAMIIGPILGLTAYHDYKKGRDPKGLARLHRPVMALGVAALAGAFVMVEF